MWFSFECNDNLDGWSEEKSIGSIGNKSVPQGS